jgi:hypothetical protein
MFVQYIFYLSTVTCDDISATFVCLEKITFLVIFTVCRQIGHTPQIELSKAEEKFHFSADIKPNFGKYGKGSISL